MPATPSPALISALISHRLPRAPVVLERKSTTRLASNAYRTLRENHLSYSPGGKSIMADFHNALHRNAPVASAGDTQVVERFEHYMAYARAHAQIPIELVCSLAAYIHALLLVPITCSLWPLAAGT